MLNEEMQHGHSGMYGDGKKIRYIDLEGAPKFYQGNVTLVSGTAIVSSKFLTDKSLIFFKVVTPLGTPGTLSEDSSTRVYTFDPLNPSLPFPRFTINSSSVLDASKISWIIINL